jgi:hypothetical protein
VDFVTGLHALELAKTYWNAYVTNATSQPSLQELATCLTLAERIFSILFGLTGEAIDDDEEPVGELRLLKGVIKTEFEHNTSP